VPRLGGSGSGNVVAGDEGNETGKSACGYSLLGSPLRFAVMNQKLGNPRKMNPLEQPIGSSHSFSKDLLSDLSHRLGSGTCRRQGASLVGLATPVVQPDGLPSRRA
jgi:hypothetical protein